MGLGWRHAVRRSATRACMTPFCAHTLLTACCALRQAFPKSFQDTVDVPNNLAGRVVGPGGAALRELEAQCGARVLVGRPAGLPLQFTSADVARAHREAARDTVRVHIFAPTRGALDAAREQLLEAIGENIQARLRPAPKPAADPLASAAGV